MADKSSKNIVILGASYAGVNTAHYIIKFVLPGLSSTNYQIYLVNPSTELYHRMAAPRAMISEELLPDNKVFFNIPEAFAHYSTKTFSFVHGKATKVHSDTRTVDVHLASGGEQSIEYHALIIATGAISLDPTLSNQLGDTEETHEALGTLRKQIKTAKTIVIGGGGPAGVETASEMGEYLNGKPGWFGGAKDPKVIIQLITGADRLLPILRPALATQAQDMLQGLGVKVRYNTRISKSEKLESGKTKVVLQDGEEIETDIYVNAIGTKPVTDFLPAEWIDDSKRVASNKETLRVDAAGSRVYAVGDVGAHTRGGMLDLFDSVPVLATNLQTDLLVAEGQKAKHGDRKFAGSTAETQIVTIGQSRGIGAFNGMKMPSFAIYMLKGRDYMAGKVKLQVEQGNWGKEVVWKNPTPVA